MPIEPATRSWSLFTPLPVTQGFPSHRFTGPLKLADARQHPAFRMLVVAVLNDLTGVNDEATRLS